MIADNLDLGRPHNVEIIFARRVRRDTVGRFRTAIDRRDNGGVVVNVFYKHSRIKQYLRVRRPRVARRRRPGSTTGGGGGAAPVYVSIDIDVFDPSAARGTGTPEAGGLSSRELLGIVGSVIGTAEAGVGVVVSQVFANTDWPGEGMARLQAGSEPADVVAELSGSDPWSADWQLVVMNAAGRYATFTGDRCVPHTSVATGHGIIALDNMLAAHIDPDMVEAYAAAIGGVGDARGSQSA